MTNRKALPADIADQFFNGESVFFTDKPQITAAPEQPAIAIDPLQPAVKLPPKMANPLPRQPVNKVTSPKASTLASYQIELIETIRRTVKKGGKEVSFVRLTQTEKDQLADIVYTYKRRGMKTTENEINRIAINFLLEDYNRNGEESMLVKVIEALLA